MGASHQGMLKTSALPQNLWVNFVTIQHFVSFAAIMAEAARGKHPEGRLGVSFWPFPPRLKPGAKGRLLKQASDLSGTLVG